MNPLATDLEKLNQVVLAADRMATPHGTTAR
jgi:hypothetical protein